MTKIDKGAVVAPERICARSGAYYDYAQDWSNGEWDPVDDGDVFDEYYVEYIRADIAEARAEYVEKVRAEERERCAKIVEEWLAAPDTLHPMSASIGVTLKEHNEAIAAAIRETNDA
jgi:hypothetical protein